MGFLNCWQSLVEWCRTQKSRCQQETQQGESAFLGGKQGGRETGYAHLLYKRAHRKRRGPIVYEGVGQFLFRELQFAIPFDTFGQNGD